MWRKLAAMVALAASSLALRADDASPVIWMDREQLWELKRSAEVRAELARREGFFEAEMATGAVPDWAGIYYNGDGLGRNIFVRISPQGGFIFTWSGCMGLYDVNYGPVEQRGGRLVMTFELPNDPETFGAPGELVPVRWGQRNYLLADEDLKPFVNAVNSGQEPQKHCIPRCGSFLLRDGDDAREVSGVPDLPAEYLGLLLDHPITGRVVRIVQSETRLHPDGSYGTRTTRVEIDLGSDDGVWMGMEFYADANPYVGSGFEIVSTQGHSSVAVKRDYVAPGEPPLEPGICISTRPGEQTCPIEQTAASR
jgi:hypothetical protein